MMGTVDMESCTLVVQSPAIPCAIMKCIHCSHTPMYDFELHRYDLVLVCFDNLVTILPGFHCIIIGCGKRECLTLIT